MLEKIDLSKALDKKEYKAVIDELWLRLGELQRAAKERKIPVMLVFEGVDAAGKGTLINNMLQALDPRGFNVYPIKAPNEEEQHRPFLWRFWTKTPARGRLAIFDRSWYRYVLLDRLDKRISKERCRRAYDEINAFERQLADDGCVILKFWLHIDKKEQKRRLQKLEGASSTSWRVTKGDWRRHKQYDKTLCVAEEMFAKTHTGKAPWYLVESHDERFATVKLFRLVIQALEKRIQDVDDARALAAARKAEKKSPVLDPMPGSILAKVDLSKKLSSEEYDEKLKKYQKRIRELEHEIYRRRIPVVALFEGWDAAGKGGNIRRLTQNLDPRGYEVTPIAAPNDIEKNHHYLWRFWNAIPKAGHLQVFDRTWYGRVLVERVEGFCSETDWRRAYREINEMEEHLANSGAVIVKFWLHIDKEAQLARFKEREATPYKQFKITEEDYRNREKWDAYLIAVDEMLFRTDTPHAPWIVVESDDKYYARIRVLKTMIEQIEAALKH